MKNTIYFPSPTTAADLMARRNAVRAISNGPNLRFISKPRIVVKLSIIEPAPIVHKRIDEVV